MSKKAGLVFITAYSIYVVCIVLKSDYTVSTIVRIRQNDFIDNSFIKNIIKIKQRIFSYTGFIHYSQIRYVAVSISHLIVLVNVMS